MTVLIEDTELRSLGVDPMEHWRATCLFHVARLRAMDPAPLGVAKLIRALEHEARTLQIYFELHGVAGP